MDPEITLAINTLIDSINKDAKAMCEKSKSYLQKMAAQLDEGFASIEVNAIEDVEAVNACA